MSNGWTISSALAVSFSLTGHTFTFALDSAGATYTATMATGARRVMLAPSASELLACAVAAMNAAAGLPGGVSFAGSWSEDGLAVITCTGDTWKSTGLPSTATGKALGFTSLASFAASHTANLAARYLALFVSAFDGLWQARQDGAAEETAGGIVYTFGGANLTFARSVKIEQIPWDPAKAAEVGSPATPYAPDVAYRDQVGDTGTARAWSLLDVLWWARNADCALTLGGFQALRTSTTERYDVGRVSSVLAPKMERHDPRLPRYLKHEMRFVLPTTGSSGTRA